ncbi:MAG: response regulator transcription factor [Acidimicrobiia bacterium]|nr:response regulator transcription factor [Acidimicrobiia bacterium]
MRLLVVEDEINLADAIARGLRRERYAVDVAYDGESAIDRLIGNAYDLVCLDWNLPDVDGWSICRMIRRGEVATLASPPPRVLMLTARDAIEDRIDGLDAGADDYLVKPFAFGELAARIRALLRRDTAVAGTVVRVGDLELDDSRHEGYRAGTRLNLTPKEFALLRFFMAHPNEVLSQEKLLEHVWDEFADPFTNTVRVTIANLRRKLTEVGGEQPIETVAGIGYRLKEQA